MRRHKKQNAQYHDDIYGGGATGAGGEKGVGEGDYREPTLPNTLVTRQVRLRVLARGRSIPRRPGRTPTEVEVEDISPASLPLEPLVSGLGLGTTLDNSKDKDPLRKRIRVNCRMLHLKLLNLDGKDKDKEGMNSREARAIMEASRLLTPAAPATREVLEVLRRLLEGSPACQRSSRVYVSTVGFRISSSLSLVVNHLFACFITT